MRGVRVSEFKVWLRECTRLACGQGPDAGRRRKRGSDEPAAETPSPRARRPRRAINYDDSEPDDGDDEDLALGPPDDDGGWD